MSSLRLIQLRSLDEFRGDAAAWEELWQRSDVALPTTRPGFVAAWVEQFAANSPLLALAVEQQGRLVAGLVLVGAKIKRVVPVGGLTVNPWARCGELLLDPNAETAEACRLLVDGLRGCSWPLLWLEDVPLEAPRWRQFRAALAAAEIPSVARVDYEVGQVEVPADWAELESGWTRNHRHKLRRIANKLDRQGSADLERITSADPADVPRLFRRAFEIENRGWKGDGGTSVLADPRMFDFYCRVGQQLAECDALDMAFLNLSGETIAFHCGSRAKGTSFGSKIGYGDRFAELSPGNALMHRLLRALHEENGNWTHDFAGPLSEWTARFATRRYPVGRLVVAPCGAIGRWLLRAYARRTAFSTQVSQPATLEELASAAELQSS